MWAKGKGLDLVKVGIAVSGPVDYVINAETKGGVKVLLPGSEKNLLYLEQTLST